MYLNLIILEKKESWRERNLERERKKDGYCCLVVNIVFEDI